MIEFRNPDCDFELDNKKGTHWVPFSWFELSTNYFVSAGLTNALILRMVCPGSVLALMVTVLV